MTTAGPFSLDADEHGYTLVMDSSWLDGESPFWVHDDRGPVKLDRDPVVRVRLNSQEGVRLWRLLDITIGAHQREGEEVKREFDRTRREGLDTRIPDHNEYAQAIEVLEHPFSTDEEEQEIARRVVTVYERAHGTEGRTR